MKKILIICYCIILSISITACSNDNQMVERQNDGEVSSVFEQIPVIEGTAMQQNLGTLTDTVTNTTPDYPAQTFENIDELLSWIQNEDIANYQEGRFVNSVSSLKALGKILYPTYTTADIALRFVEILPDGYDSDGYAVVAFYYYKGDKRGVIYVRQMNESYVKQANEKGISGYLDAKYGNEFKNAQLTETNIEAKTQLSSKSRKQSIQYIKTTKESKTSAKSKTQIVFLSDGFEVNIYQMKDVDDNSFINEICVEPVSIKK